GSDAQVRALETLASYRLSDRESLDELTRLFPRAKSIGVQRAIAGILIRSDYRAIANPTLVSALRQHRLKSPTGDDVIDVLIRRTQTALSCLPPPPREERPPEDCNPGRGPSDVRRKTLDPRLRGDNDDEAIPASSEAWSRSIARKRQHLRWVVLVRMAEADMAAPAERQLFASQMDLGLALDRDVRAVRALIDQHELVATTLDPRVHARRHAVRDHDIVLHFATDAQRRMHFAELEFLLAVAKVDARRGELHAGPDLGELFFGVLPVELEDPDVLELALDGEGVDFTNTRAQPRRERLGRLRREDHL